MMFFIACMLFGTGTVILLLFLAGFGALSLSTALLSAVFGGFKTAKARARKPATVPGA